MKHVLRPLPFLVVVAALGCGGKKGTGGGTGVAAPTADAEAGIVAALESQQDAAACRSAMLQLDNLSTSASRPTLTDDEKASLAQLFQLTPAELADVSQATFSQTDAAWLEECLLIRTAMRAMRLDAKPPAERARLGFEWACRMTYIDNRVPWPAPPLMTLQAGFGVAASRLYVILAVWRQLGLEGCLIGPASLATTPSYVANTRPDVPPTYAPLKGCAVRVGNELLRFDAIAGEPIAKGEEGEQYFLTTPLSAVSKRMAWLEKFNPGNIGVRIFEDVPARLAGFKEAKLSCGVWAPAGDVHGAARVLQRYAGEELTGRETVALRDRHRVMLVPLDKMPKTALTGSALAMLSAAFAKPFETLRDSAGSPRDNLLRGRFSSANDALEEAKSNVENARSRVETDPTLRRDFIAWSEDFQRLTAAMFRAQGDGSAHAMAQRQLENFRNAPKNFDIERAFTMGTAAQVLGAEIAFLQALVAHERAVRTDADDRDARRNWQNAREWWVRYQAASRQAGSPSPARDAHAKSLADRVPQPAK